VHNVDVTVLAQAPKIGPWREEIRAQVAALLALPQQNVNIKAKTTEYLGAIGRGEGLAALVSVLLEE
jgi:2-C-methyl-D-erythritol 2,4-cyclodiphosphate synthase